MLKTVFLFRQRGFGNAAKTSNYIFQIAEHVRPVRPKILASLTGSAGFLPELCHQLWDKDSRVPDVPYIRSEQQATSEHCAQVVKDPSGSFAVRILQDICANHETENRTSCPFPINIKGFYVSQFQTFSTISKVYFHYTKWSLVGFSQLPTDTSFQ